MTQDIEPAPLNPQELPQEPPQFVEEKISWEPPREPLKSWRLWVPLLLQTLLIISVPAQSIYTFITGKTIVLQTMPVDPYDFLTGYSQTLSYDISQTNTLQKLSGWNDLPGKMTVCPPRQNPKNPCQPINQVNKDTVFYVILEQPNNPQNQVRPAAWKPIKVSQTLPPNLPENQIALRGIYQNWSVEYGLETYYMPEDQRVKINQEIQGTRQPPLRGTQTSQPFVVEVKVDKQGRAVPVSLWVKDRNYRF